MSIAAGYEYDLFVSYAHTDNIDADGNEGWVSQFVNRLEMVLRQRLGGADGLSLYFDNRTTAANSQLTELLSAARRSALFLAIGSPSYANRDWPRQELDAFLERHGDASRLFMIECLPLEDGDHYPPPLDTHIRLEFWKPSGKRRIPVPYSPVADADDFHPLIHGLAADIRQRLISVRLFSASVPAKRAPVESTQKAEGKTVLLAQGTDDVEDESNQLRLYLGQYDEELTILPRASCYPQGGDAFRTAFSRDLADADLFVQVLGRHAGRLPPDLPEGYTRYQLDTARASNVPILQWRHPDLALDTVGDPRYAEVLRGENVIACGFEAFKRQVLERLRKPATKAQLPRSSTVFINADSKDLGVAKEIERECLKHALTTILPISCSSAEANRKDLADNLTDCDVLLFIYGDTTQDWIRSQLRFFSKVKPKRESEPRILAICSGPPAHKPDIGMTFPNARIIESADGWNMEPIRMLLAEVTA
jgi:hypothetical protein